MKVLNFFRIALCTVAVAFASSCVDPNQEPTINFPEATSYDLAIDQELELSFKAEATWKLTTDKDWLKFVDPVLGTTETLDGPAGDQTIKITTANVTSIFDEETAVISIEMGGQSKPLYNITRTAVARWAKMFFGVYGETPVELTEENPLVVEYHDMGDILVAINFQANFAWKVATFPEWVDMESCSGEANEEITSQNYKFFYVKKSAYASAQTGEFVLTDMSGNNPFSFTVSYAGLPEDKVIIKNSEGITPGLWGNQVVFAADQTEPTVIEISVMARNNEYQVYYADWSMDPLTGSDIYNVADWVTINTETPGTLKISVTSNTDKERNAFVWVLPKAMFPQGTVDLGWYKNNYNESYMFAIQQQSGIVESTNGVYVSWSNWQSPYFSQLIECVPFDSYNFDGLTLQDFGYSLPADNTYVYELPVADDCVGPVVFAPKGFPEEWYPVSDGLYRATQPGNAFYTDPTNFGNGYVYTNMATGACLCGLSYSEAAVKNATTGKLVLEFYKDEEEATFYRPSAAVILVRK